MIRSVGLLVVLGLLAGAAPAPDTHTIKIKEAVPGDVADATSLTDERSEVKVVDAAGKAIVEQTESKIRTFVYRETIVERPDLKKRATRLKRHYTKAEVKADGKAQTLSYQGQTVLIERGKDDRYRFRIEGGKEITGDNAKYLDEEFNKNKSDIEWEKLFLPSGPVRVGETWKIDPAPLVKEWTKDVKELTLDGAKATANGKLVEAYKKDGRQFGKMDFQVEVPIKDLAAGNEKIAFGPGARFTMTFHADACIDGSSSSGDVKAIMVMGGTAAIPTPDGAQAKMTLNVKITAQEQHREVPCK